MLRMIAAAVMGLVVLPVAVLAQGDAKGAKDTGTNGKGDDGPSPAALAELASRLAPSLVRVEYMAQYDKGESPGSDRWAAWRAYMASQSGGGDDSDSWEELIKQERPAEHGGFLIAPNKVFTSDPMLHPRFLKSITVRLGNQSVSAKAAAYARDTSGWILELAEPLKDAKPLSFDKTRDGPYFGVSYSRRDGVWGTRISGMRTGVAVTEDGRKVSGNAENVLVIDKAGTPVAITGSGDLPVDGSWKGSPADWPAVSSAEMEGKLAGLEQDCAKGVLRVQLGMRSPRQGDGGGGGRYARYMQASEDSVATEWNGLGVLVDERTVLVLANFKPKVTARLEKVRVFLPDGTEAAAKFAGTLKDWGAFLATLEKPIPSGAVRLATGSVLDVRDKLLLKAEVSVRGETRTAYLSRDRIDSYGVAYRGEVYPSVNPTRDSSGYRRGGGGEEEGVNFLYTLDGALVAVPIERREKVTTEERYGYRGGSGQLVEAPARLIAEVLRERSASIDAENKPLTEDEENRLAWLGVEMQGMDPELARANNVMELTNGGQSGGIVTYLYDDSPAAKAGVKVGDILLRLHVQGEPKPLEVNVEDRMGGMMDQFWQYLDRMPDEAFEQMPQPWGARETTLTRALTDLGFGTPFTAEVFRDGKTLTMNFTVTQGPAHFAAAPRLKSEELGLTARDITYEVRRYFQMKADDPGVIISKVERGSKAAVAGLKPFETIRSINDKPIRTIKDLEAAVKDGGELRIAVKRMTQGRTVKIKLDGAKGERDKEKEKEKGEDAAAKPVGVVP